MSNEKFSIEAVGQRVKKPWGHELIYTAAVAPHTGKALFIKAGHKLSLQYHTEKEETLALFSGKAIIWLENETGTICKIDMPRGKGFAVMPGQKHRIEAVEDTFILEVSAPETGTTVRVEDEYQRGDETEEMRKQDNRGWEG